MPFSVQPSPTVAEGGADGLELTGAVPLWAQAAVRSIDTDTAAIAAILNFEF
jgi:hypothetical protein